VVLLFLLIYTAVYGGANLYLFLRINHAFPELGAWRYPVALFLIFAAAAPVLRRALEQHSVLLAARPISVIGYCWVAVMLWFLCPPAGGWVCGTWARVRQLANRGRGCRCLAA